MSEKRPAVSDTYRRAQQVRWRTPEYLYIL
uniref:Uncharacterized protein n=1 Tax=virus sp. ctJLD79 TaxID=2827987 RepID=A0A8S5REB4_9VIRU|nr:MAG TPA: hypothetical protein [virus sp. ctJLD79]